MNEAVETAERPGKRAEAELEVVGRGVDSRKLSLSTLNYSYI